MDSIDVRLANSEIKKCRENYESVEMRLQFTTTIYALPIVGVDVILGLPSILLRQ